MSVGSVKYVYKYVTKGNDKITIQIKEGKVEKITIDLLNCHKEILEGQAETHQIEDPERPEAPEEYQSLGGRVWCDVLGHPAEPHEAGGQFN